MLTRKEFLIDSSKTGRMIVTSFRTGRTYYVETIDDPEEDRKQWGSIDPATKKMTVKKGWMKYKGSIDESESLITKENGFKKIHTIAAGESPADYINRIDAQYPTKEGK